MISITDAHHAWELAVIAAADAQDAWETEWNKPDKDWNTVRELSAIHIQAERDLDTAFAALVQAGLPTQPQALPHESDDGRMSGVIQYWNGRSGSIYSKGAMDTIWFTSTHILGMSSLNNLQGQAVTFSMGRGGGAMKIVCVEFQASIDAYDRLKAQSTVAPLARPKRKTDHYTGVATIPQAEVDAARKQIKELFGDGQ